MDEDGVNSPVTEPIGGRVLSAASWSTLTEIVSKSVTPVTFVVLARYLTPVDFGIVAAAVIVISLSQVVSEAGLPKAVVQRDTLDERVLSGVFWSNLVLGAVLYVVIFLVADGGAALFGDTRIAAVLRVQSLQLLLVAPAAVFRARFERNLEFKPLFVSRTATTILPSLIAIPAVLWGAGYWALTIGALVGSLAQLILLAIMSDWQPRFEFDLEGLRPLAPFAFWVTAESLLYWAFTWGDSFVVGTLLDPYSLGLYRSASMLVITLFAALISPLQPVLFSAFSRLQADRIKLMDAFERSAMLVGMVSLPAGVGLFLVGDTAAAAFLPSEWEGIGRALGILGLMHGVAWIVGLNDDLYRAIGKPKINAQVMLASLAVYLPVYVVAAQAGFDQFLWSRLALALGAVIAHMVVAGRIIDFGVRRTLWRLRWVGAALVVMTIVVALLGRVASSQSDGLVLFVQVAGGMAAYSLALAWFERDVMKDTLSRIRVLRGGSNA